MSVGTSDFMDLCWIVQCICSQSLLAVQGSKGAHLDSALSLYMSSGGSLGKEGKLCFFLQLNQTSLEGNNYVIWGGTNRRRKNWKAYWEKQKVVSGFKCNRKKYVLGCLRTPEVEEFTGTNKVHSAVDWVKLKKTEPFWKDVVWEKGCSLYFYLYIFSFWGFFFQFWKFSGCSFCFYKKASHQESDIPCVLRFSNG